MTGLDGYFVGHDAHDDGYIWRERGDYPVQVISQHQLRNDPELWDAIVELVEGEK